MTYFISFGLFLPGVGHGALKAREGRHGRLLLITVGRDGTLGREWNRGRGTAKGAVVLGRLTGDRDPGHS
jgi:hypothetical protein